METKEIIKYSVSDAAQLDQETRKWVGMYSAARIKVGLEVAMRLKSIEDSKLYLKLDEKAYPNFNVYIDSLGLSYKTARELIGLYETFVLAAGFDINELAEASYHKLTAIKPYFFDKKDGQYELTKSKAEIKEWIKDAKSDLTIEDLKQKRKEAEVGQHEHQFKTIRIRVCEVCGLKERF